MWVLINTGHSPRLPLIIILARMMMMTTTTMMIIIKTIINLSYILGEHEIKELQKAAILGTTHILQRMIICKYKTNFKCEITLHVEQTVNREQFQHCMP
jgi:hypothetical protein